MKIKVNEASGAVLDWMVAKCEGVKLNDRLLKRRVLIPTGIRSAIQSDCNYSPTRYWAQGGPIIEREKMTVFYEKGWEAYCSHGATHNLEGNSLLEAAMRCYVVSKLGDEAEVPDELGIASK